LLNIIDNDIFFMVLNRSLYQYEHRDKSEDPKQTLGGKSTIGLCCLFIFIMYFVHHANLDIGIDKRVWNETDNEEEQT